MPGPPAHRGPEGVLIQGPAANGVNGAPAGYNTEMELRTQHQWPVAEISVRQAGQPA
jgi:hypothetical protein